MPTTRTVIKTTCSDCSIDLDLDRVLGTTRAWIPSNGKRGQGHVPAHTVENDCYDNDGTGTLLVWDCPACGYADSYDLTQD